MQFIAGVDEVGRGPLAGPVYAAAVILPHDYPTAELCDSKRMSASKRELSAKKLHDSAVAVAIGQASVAEIDSINILQASLLAMQRAVMALRHKPDSVLVDGNRAPELPYPTTTIIKGDASEPAISAASIVAKVARDQFLLKLDREYPLYGFAQHKGYPTAQHIAALAKHGPCRWHRRSFGPVKRLLNNEVC